MKKIILFLVFSFTLNSFFSQDSELIKCVKKNIQIEKDNDSLTKLIISIKKDQKDLASKLEDEKKSLEEVKKENKELSKDLAEIKKVSYSKEEYNKALAAKDQEIEALKKEFKQKEEQLKQDKKKLEENNKSTLSVLSEMNGTFFVKRIKDNYTHEFIKNYPFKREDSLNFKKYDAMIISLNADPSMAELKSSKILDKASVYNDFYFSISEAYKALDVAFDPIKVDKAINMLNNLNITDEYLGLKNSKIEIIQRLTDYCKIQTELFKNLKAMDKIQDKSVRYNKIEPVTKLEKFKHYKYLREIILQYANEKFDLPETICTSK